MKPKKTAFAKNLTEYRKAKGIRSQKQFAEEVNLYIRGLLLLERRRPGYLKKMFYLDFPKDLDSLSYSRAQIAKLESGEQQFVKPLDLAIFAGFFGISVDELVGYVCSVPRISANTIKAASVLNDSAASLISMKRIEQQFHARPDRKRKYESEEEKRALMDSYSQQAEEASFYAEHPYYIDERTREYVLAHPDLFPASSSVTPEDFINEETAADIEAEIDSLKKGVNFLLGADYSRAVIEDITQSLDLINHPDTSREHFDRAIRFLTEAYNRELQLNEDLEGSPETPQKAAPWMDIKFDGAPLKAIMKAEGRTAVWLAKEIGITPAAMYKKLSGERDFRYDEIPKIAEALHINRKDWDRVFFTLKQTKD